MGLEKIKNKIKREAEQEAKNIAKETDKEIEQLKKAQKDTAAAMRAEKEQEIKAAVKLFKDKTLAQARLDAKRKLLEAREQIMVDVVKDALKKLEKRPKEYKKFIEDVIQKNKAVLEGKLTILGNKQDKETITKAIASLKIDGSFKEADISAGIILQDAKGKRIDESIDARLERKRNDIRQRMSKVMKI